MFIAFFRLVTGMSLVVTLLVLAVGFYRYQFSNEYPI